MGDRRLLQGLLAGSLVLLVFVILLTVANISRYKGEAPPGAAAVSRPAAAPVSAPAPAAAPAEPAAEPAAPAEGPPAE